MYFEFLKIQEVILMYSQLWKSSFVFSVLVPQLNLWDLSSPTRDQTQASSSGSSES